MKNDNNFKFIQNEFCQAQSFKTQLLNDYQ